MVRPEGETEDEATQEGRVYVVLFFAVILLAFLVMR